MKHSEHVLFIRFRAVPAVRQHRWHHPGVQGAAGSCAELAHTTDYLARETKRYIIIEIKCIRIIIVFNGISSSYASAPETFSLWSFMYDSS